MKKIRLLFAVVFFIITILFLYIFNIYKSPLDQNIDKIPEFQITEISKNGKLYFNSEKIQNISTAPQFNIRTMKISSGIYFKSDQQTSYAFYIFGTYFIALPNTEIHYQPQSMEFHFLSGEIFWNKEFGQKKVEIFATSKDIDNPSEQRVIGLPESGRLKINAGFLMVWNYSGELSFRFKDFQESYERQILLTHRLAQTRPRISVILPAPDFISPENVTISLNKIGDSSVKFNWRVSQNAEDYVFNLFSSPLKENLLFSNILSENRIQLDLLKFQNHREFFWQVFPYDSLRDIEGIPAKMGYIKIIGSLLNHENILEPPRLVISSISASGNVVLIQGEADTDSKLYINDNPKPININADGTFVHAITYNSLGKKTIVFRLVSPYDIETRIEKQTFIHEE